MPDFEDDWHPYEWKQPADEEYTVSVSQTLTRPVYAIIQRAIDGFVFDNSQNEAGAFVEETDESWVASAMPLTLVGRCLYEYEVRWSLIGEGTFWVRLYEQKNDAPARTDSQRSQKIVRPKATYVPRTDGIWVTQDFGGMDQLRVTDAEDHGLEATEVMAYKVINGTSYVRGSATTDRLGRWAFKGPLQPSTEHVLKFKKAGFDEVSHTITTPALA